MEATAYEGYFNDGRFYVSGKAVQIPEQRRVFVAILDDVQNVKEKDILTTWNAVKSMIEESANENDLLKDDVFCRDNSSRAFLRLEDGEFAQ
ncbi:MAG: hypothetical protein FWH17_01790 [Oscillospiraceae bacterium]|nr:hypothetical protein [Oscillospiraceae bacterium]